MPVTSEGTQPAGFRAIFRVDPKPDTDGIIHGDSPLTVEFDLCGSSSGAGGELSYLYDWDFDHVANVVDTGDACRKEHSYNLRLVPGVRGNVIFETNVCVVSGNPRVHGPGTFFSCRTFRISLPVPSATFPHHTGYGQSWSDGVPTGTYNLAQATRACEEYVLATGPSAGSCITTLCSCSPPAAECTYNLTVSGPQRFWFYAGPFIGNTTNNSCSFGLIWD